MKHETAIDVLIEGCLRNDRRSQGQLYARFRGFAMGICLRYATDRNEATENMNKGFQKVFVGLKKCETERRFKAWIGRIMINASIDHLRSRGCRGRIACIEDAELIDHSNSRPDLEYKDILALVQRLPKVLRKVFTLWAIEGYTHKEMSVILGKSEGTCKFHLFQARELLRKMISRGFGKICATLVLLVCTMQLTAQLNKQIDTTIYSANPIIPMDKAMLLKSVDLIFNMQYANNNYFTNGKYTNTEYALNQFNLEIIGQVFDGVFFRFRDEYTRQPIPQTVDNVNHSVDLAFIDIKVSPKFHTSFGKLSADYGGYEFEANPIDIYQYNDLLTHSDNFLAGAGVSWNISSKHQVGFQLLNARTSTFTQLYDSMPGMSPSKFPALAVTTWRGSFAEKRFNTIWSLAAIREARQMYILYMALGNQLSLKKWLIQYDLKMTSQNIDRSDIVSGFMPDSMFTYRLLKTSYIEHWLHVERSIAGGWKVTLTAFTNYASWLGNPDPEKKDHLRSSYGLIPAVEFYPSKKINLRFFANYIGRYYNYTDYAREKFGLRNSTTGTIEIGFAAPLVVL